MPRSEPRRLKLVVAVTFPIYPPRGGGQSRIFHLYRNLARHFDIRIVSLAGSEEPAFSGEIAPGLHEVRVPKSAAHQEIENRYSETVGWVPVTDIVATEGIESTPGYLHALSDACHGADVVVACHPYFARLLRRMAPDLPLWYEAQDVELTLKEQILGAGAGAPKLLSMVRSEELFAWQEASFVFACTEADLDSLKKLYGPTTAKTLVVPNGFAEEDVVYADAATRRQMKSALGLGGQPVVLFMGSWHGPNLDAIELIQQWARGLPHVVFLILGSAGLKFAASSTAPNVKYLGVVDDAQKQMVLSAADVAINPMAAGTGSNLKMFDYVAAGVPVISTPFGARGAELDPGKHFICADIDDFLFTLIDFLVSERDMSPMCEAAADRVRSCHSWAAIASSAYHYLDTSVLPEFK